MNDGVAVPMPRALQGLHGATQPTETGLAGENDEVATTTAHRRQGADYDHHPLTPKFEYTAPAHSRTIFRFNGR